MTDTANNQGLFRRAWEAFKRACTPHWDDNAAASITTGAVLGSAIGRPVSGLGIGAAVGATTDERPSAKPEG